MRIIVTKTNINRDSPANEHSWLENYPCSLFTRKFLKHLHSWSIFEIGPKETVEEKDFFVRTFVASLHLLWVALGFN